ncbi:MAG TPA: hypothetical protein VER33_27000 [Polyangiaceae bacterium]|nr:hypothetical protein [Polyangiaceae bacterium]
MHHFIRGQGVPADLARDMTQGFFEGLLTREDLSKVDLSRGTRFRSWLRTAARSHFLNQLKQLRAGKRLLDEDATRGLRAMAEATRSPSAERWLDQRWACQVIGRAWLKLAAEYARTGDLVLFEHLKKTLCGEDSVLSDEELCRSLGRCDSYVRVARRRMKQDELPRCLRETLADMGIAPAAIDEELRALHDALA